MKQEHDGNWHNAYEEGNELDLKEDANIVSSHATFMIKEDHNLNLKLKSGMVVHSNRDSDKDRVRLDRAVTDMAVIKMLLSIGT